MIRGVGNGKLESLPLSPPERPWWSSPEVLMPDAAPGSWGTALTTEHVLLPGGELVDDRPIVPLTPEPMPADVVGGGAAGVLAGALLPVAGGAVLGAVLFPRARVAAALGGAALGYLLAHLLGALPVRS